MGELSKADRSKVRKPLLWIGIASIIMTFAGLTSGYVVSRSSLLTENRWLQFALPTEFYWATAAIVLSSIALFLAKRAVKKNNQTGLKAGLWLTTILGLGFAVLQYRGWISLMDQGFFFTGEGSSNSVSWVYVLTFLHWLHILSGLIVLLVTLGQSYKNAYSSEEHIGLDMTSIFWHFLDVLWIYLFFFLVFIR